MDRISGLPDELLLRVLSLLPNAKDVVATMVLSKRWQFLWMMVPKLVYDDSYQNPEYGEFARFVDRSLFMREASGIDTLHFKLGQLCGNGDIQWWIRAARKFCVRELIIEIDSSTSVSPAILPRSLYTECRMLVTLKLNNAILVDVSAPTSFPSLKTLSLVSVKYPGDEFVKSFLSNCHVLENLVVEQCLDDNVSIFSVKVPSLKRLVLHTSEKRAIDYANGFVVEAPSLEYLDILDQTGGFCVIENGMPNIAEAYVNVYHNHAVEFLSSITSVKRLYLCLITSKDMYPVKCVFHRLVHITLCTCEIEWLNLLMSLLRGSPKLISLKLEQFHRHRAFSAPLPLWDEQSSVPECVLSSLETVEWVNYEGTEAEKELVEFFLRNGSCLKKFVISPKSVNPHEKYEMIKELTLSCRRSPTCQLAFG
ncbi:F-box-like domain superfamily [Arabidopsis suecica]|uniref:F-box-like domain superfamily n=1 Tax=Arabidopsis suecica TaxID=45249 RepID=A0A8T1XRK8_ARASU|nr:F-box-like domain superfamily [Arabidopsis suecica]